MLVDTSDGANTSHTTKLGQNDFTDFLLFIYCQSTKGNPMRINNYQALAHCAVGATRDQFTIATQIFQQDAVITGQHWQIPVATLRARWHELVNYYGAGYRVPLAGLVFDTTAELDALGHFLPLIPQLNPAQRQQFRTKLNELFADRRLQITLWRERSVIPATLSMRALIAGQLLLCFWQRPDVLELVVASQPKFALYTDATSYARAGGVGGGCYVVEAHQILLQVERLYEGFFTPIPDVCPLLHELGHLLDGTAMRVQKSGVCRGELPGMTASELAEFGAGKRAEYRCYQAWYHGRPPQDGQMPLGHPYVFQTDGEFLAGHWEMFWRNPHSMATTSPQLFAALCRYTRQDPRQFVTTDYLGYVRGNREFYQSGERPWPSAIQFHVAM